jgi:CelD/BcsL family acetyltransferase involved in cellulose biosynthesis
MALRSAVADTTDGSVTEFEVLRDVAQIAEASPAWAALLVRSSYNRAFSRPTWFGAWFEVFEEFAPYVVVARRADQLVGILPLAIAPDGDAILSPCDWCDYNDAVVAGDDPRLAAALLAWSLAARQTHRRVILRRVRHDSCLARALALLLGSDPLVDGPDPRDSASASTWPWATGDTWTGGARHSARAWRRRDDGPAKGSSTSASCLRNASGPATCRPNSSRSTSRASARRAASTRSVRDGSWPGRSPALFLQGRVRAFGVFAGGRLAAMDLCLTGPAGLALWNGGFLTEVAAFSPGALLLDFEIRQVASEGFTELDLLRGEQAWKARWSTGRRRLGQVVLEAMPGPQAASPGSG